MRELIDRLRDTGTLSRKEWVRLIRGRTPALSDYLFEQARQVRIRHYGHDVYIRGLIEFTNYCKNNCYYCGIQNQNSHIRRYRLTEEDILSCCETGYRLGFRTFVLQGGEDPWFMRTTAPRWTASPWPGKPAPRWNGCTRRWSPSGTAGSTMSS